MGELTRILYVDDEEDIRSIVEMSLELGGYQIKLCESGFQALEEVEGFAPDLILLDVMMPGIDGPETLARLRQIPSLVKIPVLFMTAKAQRQEIDDLLKLGAVDVLTKPFDPMALADNVQAIWDRL